MNIEVLAGNTVKITLNSNDMTDYDIKYETLSRKSPDTKRLLIELLSAVRLEKNLDLLNGRLFIEAFPRSDGGCMLYISSLTGTTADIEEEFAGINSVLSEQSRSHKYCGKPELYNKLICESSSAEEIGALCRSLCGLSKHTHSALYGTYEETPTLRLVLSQKGAFSPLVRRLFSEYGQMLAGSIDAAETEEYYRCIIASRAVETAAALL